MSVGLRMYFAALFFAWNTVNSSLKDVIDWSELIFISIPKAFNCPLVFLPQANHGSSDEELKEIVESCDLKNWREALAAVLTYAKADEFSAFVVRKWILYDIHGMIHCK